MDYYRQKWSSELKATSNSQKKKQFWQSLTEAFLSSDENGKTIEEKDFILK